MADERITEAREAAVRELVAERDDLRARVSELEVGADGVYEGLRAALESTIAEKIRAQAKVERLTKALEELRDLIGGHEGWCQSDMQDRVPCRCGYQLIVDALAGKGGE